MGKVAYVFVRNDIHATTKVVQVGHACLKAGSMFRHKGDTTTLIVLKVKNEVSLLRKLKRIRNKKIKCSVFYEPDNNLGYTAFCTEPIGNKKRKIFEKYKLLMI